MLFYDFMSNELQNMNITSKMEIAYWELEKHEIERSSAGAYGVEGSER